MKNTISIKGARDHNLKNISVTIPKNKLVVFTGVSGSGKSTLAFDTIYAEGQRRYVESLSAYARQFLGVMNKPDVDNIEGLSPAISIDQKSGSHNPRSTVGTVTEIYDYLRLLFARAGHPHCPKCNREIAPMDKEQIVTNILTTIEQVVQSGGKKPSRFMILSPVVRDRKGEYSGLLDNLKSKGYRHARIDGIIFDLSEEILLIKTNRHSIDAVIDRLSISANALNDPVSRSNITSRLRESVEQALNVSDGLVVLSEVKDAGFDFPEKPKEMTDHLYSEKLSCPHCNLSLPEIEPRIFSFNSPHGACETCKGLGTLLKVKADLVLNGVLSITEGGILPFTKHFENDTWYARLILAAMKENNIDPKLALSELTAKQTSILLYGTGSHTYEVEGMNRFGKLTSITEPFAGIVAELERRYVESSSDFARHEIEKYMRTEMCKTCSGTRLRKEARSITIAGRSIIDVNSDSVGVSLQFLSSLLSTAKLSERELTIATPILNEVVKRLTFLVAVGLDYLTLGRDATTLAGGEGQRIRLASQIGSGLSGVLYVLDEPSIGLHPRDNQKLIQTLKDLRDLGNTVLVVEHDREMIESADYVVDFGPGGGKHGGLIVAKGTLEQIKENNKSLTGQYLAGKKEVKSSVGNIRPSYPVESKISSGVITLKGAQAFNLQNVDASFPLKKLTCVTGVSGSGKSTLIVETLHKALKQHFNPYYRKTPGAFSELIGAEQIKHVHLIDQSPIGKTPRSNPATYVGAFTAIRNLYANLKESKARGYSAGRFSFNVKGGRCENCEGQGEEKIEMQFLPPVWVQCETCHGARYNNATLEVEFKGKNISDILHMTIAEAKDFFRHIPTLSPKLETLHDVGLGYIQLGQSAPTLSGGEAQRVKLAAELSKRSSQDNLYILDEPTTGLHFADLEKLLHVLQSLVRVGNTVIVIEHNIEIIRNADHIIDLGPGGGSNGGQIVQTGTLEEIAKNKQSCTAAYVVPYVS